MPLLSPMLERSCKYCLLILYLEMIVNYRFLNTSDLANNLLKDRIIFLLVGQQTKAFFLVNTQIDISQVFSKNRRAYIKSKVVTD